MPQSGQRRIPLLAATRGRRDDSVSVTPAAERDFPEEILLDGEVVIRHDGRLDFGRLQRRLNRKIGNGPP
ncbi:hypothetical protein [Streptomyces rimosus]|uniref:hypothetical protein n=1 Tax=Streptomyces rimosus TaxID=1927 RepID=UPI000A9EEB75|nr:hypothetical protein [Streptomyces rimosus]